MKRQKKAKSSEVAPKGKPNSADITELHVDDPLSKTTSPLPIALGQDGFFELGDICHFFGALVVVHMIQLIGGTISVVCRICIVHEAVATGMEEGCKIWARPDQLTISSVKLSSSMKHFTAKLKETMVLAMKELAVKGFNLSYHTKVRTLKIVFFLRKSCKELLQGRSLRKSVSTINDAADFSAFEIVNGSHKVKYTVENGYDVLDKLMGSKWDVYACSSHPLSHFVFIRSVEVNISLGNVTFLLIKGMSTSPITDDYRKLAVVDVREPTA